MVDFEGSQNRPETWIQPTNSFFKDLDTISGHLGPAADQFLSLLIISLARLRRYEWDESLPIKPYGIIGDSFIYEFSDAYSFTFRFRTDRDEQGRPLRDHYFLKRLLRKK